MNEEQKRLLNLLNQNKITTEEYNKLSAILSSVANKPNFFNFLVNPFQKIVGWYACLIGILIILLMSYLADKTLIHFPSLFSYIYTGNMKQAHVNIFKIILENIFVCLTLSISFFACAKILQQKHLRFIDFIGTVMLARISYFMVTIILFICYQINKNYFLPPEAGRHINNPFIMFIVFSGLIWQITLLVNAFKESSGLSAHKLWISFIISIVITEVLTGYLFSIFL